MSFTGENDTKGTASLHAMTTADGGLALAPKSVWPAPAWVQ